MKITCKVVVGLTRDQKLILQRKAAKKGLKLVSYCRMRLLEVVNEVC